MKIGLFTDTYRPSVNGVVYVTEILRRNFEALGHEVYIFAPASGLNIKADPHDDHVIRFPAVPSGITTDNTTSLFFPPRLLKQIKELNLDMFHFLVPAPVGLMALYAAHKLDKPVVAEYCTDYFQYAEHYPMFVPVLAALSLALPFTFKVSRTELMGMLRAGRPRLHHANWSREVIKNLLTVIHSHCDAVIVHSRKSEKQLKDWQDGDNYPIHIIPTGVDAAPKPTPEKIAELKEKWNIASDTEVVLYLGRLSAEKNLHLLIDMMAELIKWRPQAKLVFVGDFDYREKLEAHAQGSPAADHIVFVGKMVHEEVGAAYALAKVFAFPSVTDTQSLTLHEATQAGLPVVMVDEPVTEVVKEGVNGYFAKNDPADFATKVCKVLEDPSLQKKMGTEGKKIASQFSELAQTKKIVDLYDAILKERERRL